MPSGAKKRKAAKKKKEVGLTHPPDSPPPTRHPHPHGNGKQQQQQHNSGSDDGHMEPEEKHTDVAEVMKETAAVSAEVPVPASSSAAADVVLEEPKDEGGVSVEFVEEEKEKVAELPPAEGSVVPFVGVEPANPEVVDVVEAQGEQVEAQADALVAEKAACWESEVPDPVVKAQDGLVEALIAVKLATRESEVAAPAVEAPGEQVEAQAEALAVVEPASWEGEVAAPAVALPEMAGEKPPEIGESLPENKSPEIPVAVTEAGHGSSLPVRRATLWNCCGLLDVFSGSER